MSGDAPTPRANGASTMDEALRAELQRRTDGAALQAIYEAIPAAPAASAEASDTEVQQREAAWARLQARLQDPSRVPAVDDGPPVLALVKDEPAPPRRAVPSPRTRPWWVAVAAALVVAVGGPAVWSAVPVVHEVAAGSPARLDALPDGSRLWLAPGARVSYSRRLGWPAITRPSERMMRLEGEAFFEVARDGRPFRVITPDATVQVLGTRFAVRAATGARGSRVQVEEGRVAVSAGAARVELTAGQGTVVTSAGLAVRDVPVQRVAVWRRGGLAALDEPLGDVLAELARRFGVTLEIDPAVDARATVSLFYPASPGVEVVLRDLCTAQGLTFERTSRGFRVSAGTRAP